MSNETGEPLTHLILVAANTTTFCGVKTDKYTQARVEVKYVTCLVCLTKALEWHELNADKIKNALWNFDRKAGS